MTTHFDYRQTNRPKAVGLGRKSSAAVRAAVGRKARRTVKRRSKRAMLRLGTLACALSGASVANAQFAPWPYGGGPAYPAAYAFGPFDCFPHSATAAESALTGWSRYYRAWGQLNYLNALAVSEYERANSLALANRRAYLAPFIAAREAESAARAARCADRQRELTQQRMNASLAAQALLPAIESTGGQLSWPAELQKPEYEQDLKTIGKCLERWIESFSLDTEHRSQLKRKLNELDKKLRRQQQFVERTVELAEARDLVHKIDTLVFSKALPDAPPRATDVAQAQK
ncbi:MAG: hypothetical protein WD063_01140 [Pirellulales bacterium]